MGTARKYLTEIIGKDYEGWRRDKIFLNSPTGTGKSTFIVSTLLNYLALRRKRMIILCNRRLLREQYWHQLFHEFERYSELKECVEVCTYQELAETLKQGYLIDDKLRSFDCICLDEVHYFYQDTDFNGFGTFVTLQAIIQAGFPKLMIFMSATLSCVRPILEETLKRCQKWADREAPEFNHDKYFRIREYGCGWENDYSHLCCKVVPDFETLCGVMANSEKKSIMFLDDKEGAEKIRQILSGYEGIQASDITILNAENLDDSKNAGNLKQLAIGHRMPSKILITTSVLDNGVSIHDPDVENVFILTESKTSFLQMLGRVRSEGMGQISLYFIPQEPAYYERRALGYENVLKVIEWAEHVDVDKNRFPIFYTVWEDSDSELADIYRKIFVLCPKRFNLFMETRGWVQCYLGDTIFSINNFAKEKIGNMFMALTYFNDLAICDPMNVIFEQMSWIGKNKEELQVLKSTYKEQRTNEFVNALLSIQFNTKEEFVQAKIGLCDAFRKEFFADIVTKSGSFSDDKLKQIIAPYGLELVIDRDESNKNRYTIRSV